MEKLEGRIFEPYFELELVPRVARYVKFWLDNTSQNLQAREQVSDQLRKIFSNDSPYLKQAFDGFEFRAVFIQRLGKSRLYRLAHHLLVINRNIFDALDWEMMLTKRDWKKLMKRLEKINKEKGYSESLS